MAESPEERAHRAELEDLNRELAGVIRSALSPGTGFALLVFDFRPDGAMTYVSNAERASMCRALRDLLSRLEKGGGN